MPDMTDLIFVVDGEFDAGQPEWHCLQRAGYEVRTFWSLSEFKNVQGRRMPSLMLIATTLPDGSGLDLCRQIRMNSLQARTPVIVLSADTDDEQSCAAALEAGADNYLCKPFSAGELMAKVQSTLLRSASSFPAEPSIADIVIDHSAMQLSVRGNEVATTSLEFRLVNYLARHRGHVFARDVLLDAVWGEMRFVNPRSVDACVRRLREKIEPDVTSPTYLKTIRGIGYRFDAVAVWPGSDETCRCPACTLSSPREAVMESLRLLKKRRVASQA